MRKRKRMQEYNEFTTCSMLNIYWNYIRTCQIGYFATFFCLWMVIKFLWTGLLSSAVFSLVFFLSKIVLIFQWMKLFSPKGRMPRKWKWLFKWNLVAGIVLPWIYYFIVICKSNKLIMTLSFVLLLVQLHTFCRE